MRDAILTLCLLIFSWFPSVAQTTECNTTVDAREDIEMCEPGGEINLIGTVNTDPDYTIADIQWSGPNIVDPASLVTTASTDVTTDYNLTIKIRQQNLIQNGDFEAGNTAFSSDYQVPTPPYPNPGQPLYPEGYYLVSDDPSDTHNNFAPCSDHTTGNGNMMVVNGDTDVDAQVWCQTINVQPGTDYEFSAWGTSVISSNPAQLQFTIDGIQIGNIFTIESNTCSWNEFFEEWTSNNSGAPYDIQICITNQNTQGSGNDFALDDIFFGAVCEITDTKHVEILPNVEHTLDTILCQGESIEINNQTVSGEGEHGPFIFQAANGCDSLLTIDIDYINIVAVIENPDFLTCDNEQITLSAINSLIEPGNIDPDNVVYQWSTIEGSIISGNGSSEIVVDAPGTYFLTVFYDNGNVSCTSMQTEIEVLQDITPPEANIVVEQENCNNAIWDLSATTDVQQASYQWTTQDGQLPGATDLQSVVATAEGTYILEVTNQLNGCKGYDTVSVELNSLNFDITGDLRIDCEKEFTVLYMQGPATYDYQWFTENGHFEGGATNDSILVDRAGDYHLIASSQDCKDTISVTVESLIDTINISLPGADTLSCKNPSLSITAEITGAQNYNLLWSTQDGSIQSPPDSSSIVLNSEGIYYISVSTAGNCTAMDSIVITAEDDIPHIDLRLTDTLNCRNNVVMVDATQSDTTEENQFEWSTIDGIIDNQKENGHIITISQSGTYVLEITDTLSACSVIDSVEVTADYTQLNVDAGITDTLTCQQNSLQLQAVIDNMSLVDSIQWTTNTGNISSGGQSLSPVVTATGTYILEVWNATSHCRSVDSVTIYADEDLPLIVPTEKLVLNCKNPSVIIDKTGSSQDSSTIHQWEALDDGNIRDGKDSYTIEVDAAGTYVFTIINQTNFCESSDTILVTENFKNPNVNVPLPDTINCALEMIEISPQGLSHDYTYLWTTTVGNINSDPEQAEVNVDAPAEYILEITDTTNGCKQTILTDVLIDTFAPGITVMDTMILTCDKNEVIISPTIDTEGNTAVQWSTVDGNIVGNNQQSTITADAGGTYVVEVTDNSSSCLTIDTVVIVDDRKPPELIAGSDAILTCADPTTILTLESYEGTSLQWYDENGTTIATDTSRYEATTAGIYYIEATDASQCTSLDSITVSENKEVDMVSAGKDAYLGCKNATVELSPTIAQEEKYDFFWIYATDTLTYKKNMLVDTPGIYTVYAVMKDNGCFTTDEVIITEVDSISIDFNVFTPACANDNGTVRLKAINGGVPPYSAEINNTTISEGERLELAPGTYTLVVEDDYTCRYESEITIENGEEFRLEYPSFYEISYGDSAHIQPINYPDTNLVSDVKWRPTENLSCSDCLDPYAYPVNTEQYLISATDTSGCVGETSVTVRVDRSVNFYIPNAFSPNRDGINEYFRPFPGEGVEKVTEIEVFNRWGDRMYSIRNPNLEENESGWDGTFRGERMMPGVYMYKIKLLLNDGRELKLNGSVTLIR